MIRLVKHANADIVKSLEKEAPALAELQQRFYTMLANCRDEGEAIDIICYHEELPMAVLGMVCALRFKLNSIC
jgi:predicted cobalt transporter CbtA